MRISLNDLLAVPRNVIDFERRLMATTLRSTVRLTSIVVGVPVAAVPILSAVLARLDGDQTPVQAHPFLSERWIEAARAIRSELEPQATTKPPAMRMNQIVTDVPFGDGTLNAHMDSSSGELVIELGHIESPDITVTLPYDVARALLVDQDQQAAMQAFMSGRIKVDGDMMKLMAMQTQTIDPVALEAAVRIKAITA